MKETVKSFLQRNPLATLITLGGDQPHATPMFVHVDDNLHCWCVTKEGTQKYENILENPNVIVSFVDRDSVTTGEVVGRARVVLAGAEVAAAITKLQTIMSDEHAGYWLPPVAKLDGSQHVVIEVVPSTITLVDYSDPTKLEPDKLELAV